MPFNRPFLFRDPSTLVLAFAIWAAINGVSLILPGNAFALNPIYADMARLAWSDTAWGIVMLADAILLLVSVFLGSVPARAAIAVISAPLWFFAGVLLVAGASRIGLLSAAGGFDLFGASALAGAGAQWALASRPLPSSQRETHL